MSEEIYTGEVIELPTGRAWDILPGEPTEWFSRFEKFRLMMPEDRSIKALWLVEKARRKRQGTLANLPGLQTFNNNAKRYRWKDRARLSDIDTINNSRTIDEMVKQELSRSAEDEKAIHRTQRRRVLQALFDKLIEAITDKDFELKSAKNSELIQFARIYLQQNREEFEATAAKVARFKYDTLSDQELYDLIKERINTLSEPA